MKSKLLVVLCFVLIIAGAVFSFLANIPEAKVAGFALIMLGAGAMSVKLWNDRDTKVKGWVTLISVVLVGLGSFLAGLFGFISESQLEQVIGLVFAIALVIAGVIASVVTNKRKRLE